MNRTGTYSHRFFCILLAVQTALGVPGGHAFTPVDRLTVTAAFNFFSVPQDPVSLEAGYLLRCQIADATYGADDLGCFNNVVPGSGPDWVVPRENGTAILGLIEAFAATGNQSFKTGAVNGVEYLKNRQEADGSWCSQYNETAVDPALDARVNSNKSLSGAGSAIMAFFKVMQTGWEDPTHQYYDSAKRAAQYIMACVDNKPGTANGLAGSGKEYGSGQDFPNSDESGSYRWGSWSWVSDNSYAYLGLTCVREWAFAKGDTAFATQCDTYAQGILQGINTYLKNPSNAVWYRVVNGDGQTVSDSTKIDALCYYPQKYDLPVPQYGSENIAQWMADNLQVSSGTISSGYGAFVWGDAGTADESDRRSQGFSMEAWLALTDIAGITAALSRQEAKIWWEAADNTNGSGQLWDVVNGGIVDWYDPDGSPDGFVAPSWQKFIDTSANCIFVYRGGYNHNFAAAFSPQVLQSPQISHLGIEQVSPVATIIVATGTVADNAGVETVEISYFTDTTANLVTNRQSVPDPAGGSSVHYFATDNARVITTMIEVPDNSKQYAFRSEITPDVSNGMYLYYRIKAMNVRGYATYWPVAGSNEFHRVRIDSAASAKLGTGGGTLRFPDGNPEDGETSLEVPSGALASGVDITMNEMDPGDTAIPSAGGALMPRPLSVFRFGPSGLVFSKPAKLTLLYRDLNRDGIIDGTTLRADSLKIMWWDGFDWRVVGGAVDPLLNVVSARINHFSLYALFPMPALTDSDYRPKERIITPSLVDTRNDYATFGGLQEGDIVTIYDVSGQRIRQLRDTTIWDGKDDGDNLVESGLYIYQIKLKATGKIVNGTIVVAK